MSQAISIVKPGSSSTPKPSTTNNPTPAPVPAPVQPLAPAPLPSKLNPISAQPFIPTNQPTLHSIEYDYSDGVYNGAYYPPKLLPKLDHHLYHHHQPTIPTNQPTFFLPPNLHQHLTTQIDLIEQTTSTGDPSLPESVGSYSGLVKLDRPTQDPIESSLNLFGPYPSILYKAWNQSGTCVGLWRIPNLRVNNEKQIITVEPWTRIKHPGLVHFHEAFTTKQFGDYSVVFVYDFHPNAVSVYHAHLSPLASLPPNPWSNNNNQFRTRPNPPLQPNGPGGLVERVLWSYIVQLSSVIKTIHASGLAVRNLDPSRVIISSKNRIRISGCGIMDVISHEQGIGLNYQQDDLLSLGKLIIALGCGSSSAVHNLPASVDQISRLYSPELKNVLLYLLSKPSNRKSIDEVISLCGSRVLDELNSSLVAEDKLERELLREVENGRLVRLLAKFGFINERPE